MSEQNNKPVEKSVEVKAAVDHGKHSESRETASHDQLIMKAGALFAEHGIDGVSVREIAKAAGVNLSLISYYFGGKEGLYREVLLHFAKSGQDELGAILQGYDADSLTLADFKLRIRRVMSAVMNVKYRFPHIAPLLQREVLSGLPYAREIHEGIFTQLAESIVGMIQTAQKKGFFNPDIHPYILFFSFIHAQDMFASVAKCGTKMIEDKCPKLPEQTEEYVEQIFKIFIEGNCYEK